MNNEQQELYPGVIGNFSATGEMLGVELQTEDPKVLEELYEKDFYLWSCVQAKLLRNRALHLLDIENLCEEIEALGKQERRELVNRFGILLGHLLKWQHQPDYRSKSWRATLREQRYRIEGLIAKNPSLKPYLPEALKEAYPIALALAVRETTKDYEDLPATCLYSITQALDTEYLPD